MFTIFATIHVSVKTQSRVGYYFGNFTVNVMLESLAVFVWVKYNAHLFKKLDRIITKISAYCFGVYLVHPLIMEQVSYKLGFNTLSFNPVLSVPVICILAFSISLAISAVINKIPVIKKYIV